MRIAHDAAVPPAIVPSSATPVARVSFEDRMATADVRRARAAPTSSSTARSCADCSTRECVVACPANLFVPDQRRRHPLQLRAVLRVRHLLHGLQPRGRDHLDLPRGRPRRRLPPHVIAVCLKWVAELGEPGDERFGGISLADQAALEIALHHAELASER